MAQGLAVHVYAITSPGSHDPKPSLCLVEPNISRAGTGPSRRASTQSTLPDTSFTHFLTSSRLYSRWGTNTLVCFVRAIFLSRAANTNVDSPTSGSEQMSLVQLIVPTEVAHDTIAELGELGNVQFKDVSAYIPLC